MSRLHTHKHGKSHSTRPINVRMQPWIFQKSDEIVELIKKYGKDNLSSSQIGIKLRDQHAIPLATTINQKINYSNIR